MPKQSRPTDVFLYIDMLNGPEFTDPDTGEVSLCWLWKGKLGSDNRPYVQISGKRQLAYRLTYQLVTGQDLGALLYRHKCDNSWCTNPKHGTPGTHQQNMDDMKQRERHGMSHHAVRQIRKLIDKGLTDAQIAELTGKGRASIYDIRMGNTFSHVKNEE